MIEAEIRKCKSCGREFIFQVSRIVPGHAGRGQFCSVQCRWREQGKKLVKRVCDLCDKGFLWNPKSDGKGKFCSRACVAKSIFPLSQTAEARRKNSASQIGKEVSLETREKLREISISRNIQPPKDTWIKKGQFAGDKHWSWKGGISKLNNLIYASAEMYHWRKGVFRRDDYTCRHCGKRGGVINAHHIKTFNEYPELRFDLGNGLTLCVDCHNNVHGKKPRTVLIQSVMAKI